MKTLGAFAVLAFATQVLGCAGDETATADEADLTAAKPTRIASSLEGPGNLRVVGDRVVFSTAHFDASGDPELDQQFASWRGALWSKPVRGAGNKKKLVETAGAVIDTAVSGSDLLVVDSTYFGVTKVAIPTGEESDFYNDFSHFPDDGEDLPTLGGIAIGKSGVYVTRPGSEVMSMKADGSAVKTFAKTWKSGWVEGAQAIVVLDDAVFWSSEQQGEQGSTYNLYRASLSGSKTPKKLATYPTRIRDLATDGKIVVLSREEAHGEPGEIDLVAADGKSKPRALVEGQASADNLVFDDRFGLLYTEWTHGVMRVAKEDLASSDPVEATVVVKVKAPTSLAITTDDLYVASDPGEINEKKGEILRYDVAKLGL